MEKVLTHQYELLQGSRQVLLDYCETLSPAHFTQELTHFGRGSIRNLLVHTVNTYEFWLGKFAQRKHMAFTAAEIVREASEVRSVYATTDALVGEFLQSFRNRYEGPLMGEIRGQTVEATPLTLFTHVLTHEFHHKGQILSMSRHLGYTPPDTDVLR